MIFGGAIGFVPALLYRRKRERKIRSGDLSRGVVDYILVGILWWGAIDLAGWFLLAYLFFIEATDFFG